MKINHLMHEILEDQSIFKHPYDVKLEPRLEAILTDGIVKLEDCIFFRAFVPENFDIDLAIQSSYDRTELECLINHIHVDDYLDQPPKSLYTLLEQGIRFASNLQVLLAKTCQAIIILAFTLDPIVDCNIRFHKKRPEEKWLADEIERYDEALLIFDDED